MADTAGRKRILVQAYRCEPGRGSERGAGWGMVQALQQIGDCSVIAGPHSGAVLEAWLQHNPRTSLEVTIVDEPRWAQTATRHRIGEFLVYLAWQRRVRAVAQRMAAEGDFDIGFHATLSAFWLPSIITELDLPSVWGPVGGAVTTPRKLLPLLGWKGVVDEAIDWFAVRAMSLLPSTRRTWARATVRVAQNDQTVRRLPGRIQSDTTVLNHAIFHDVPALPDTESSSLPSRYVAWVSPMESRKGPELAVRSLASTSPDIEMIMVGDGPERSRIEGIVRSLDLNDRITFTGQVSHDDALEIVGRATVALFTGLREEGGLALTEALMLGTPVVVLANGGAATIAGGTVDPDAVELVQPRSLSGTIAAMGRAIERQMTRATVGSTERTPLLDREAALRHLELVISQAIDTGSPSTG